jgi:hypothetical protein
MLNIVRTAIDAIFNTSPNYVTSIFGDSKTWLDNENPYSEYKIASDDFLKIFKYTSEATIPPFLSNYTFFKPFVPKALESILFLEEASIIECKEPNAEDFEDEKWFFINGIITNEDVAKINGRYISHLFCRPVTVLHNPTNSIGIDVMQSMAGKFGHKNLAFAEFSLPHIIEALETKKKVVLIGHSQGTLIISTILDILVRRKTDNLHLLEIYAFANCAEEMTNKPIKNPKNRPWIESFANEHDVVAKLGILAPHKQIRGIQIDGELFVKKDGRGHFLNIHYLEDFAKGKYKNEKKNIESRLLGYLYGKTDL